jgi:hypothetical protein
VLLCLPAAAHADWLKMDPPPDVDKDQPNLTCWLATAANMLAGADYGHSGGSPDLQARADYIYGQLVEHFGTDE